MLIRAADSMLDGAIAKREQAMREDLRRYVEIPTGFNHTPGLDELRGHVVRRCEALGATTELHPGGPRPAWLHGDEAGGGNSSGSGGAIPPAAICRGPLGPGDAPSILIASHLDTVFDPRGPFTKLNWVDGGSKAVGPGVVDMKGGIVIALHALEALAECGVPVRWTYFFNSDEETGTYHSAAALMEEAKRHDWGLATEPALPDGGLAVERKGSGQFIVEAFGKGAHAGRDFEKGISAVYLLARTLAKVEELTDLPQGVTVNVGPVRGGAATNIVPDYAAAWGNVRFPTAQAGERFQLALEALDTTGLPVNGGAGESGNPVPAPGRVRIRHSMNRPAKPMTEGTRRLAEIARGVAEGLGQSLPFASTGGVCDGNLMQAAGLPTIDSLGVRGGGLHTHSEWIETRSLVERCRLFAGVLVALSQRGGSRS